MSSRRKVPTASAATSASEWVVRRDRGLSAAEQDAYCAWLRENPQHGEALKAGQKTLSRLMQLGEWQPGFSNEPNPDLFAPAQPWRARFTAKNLWRVANVAIALGAAAVFTFVLLPTDSSPPLPSRVDPESPFLVRSERVDLIDGSVIELKSGSRLTTAYTRSERRVRLEGGEGSFTVAKDPNRPFVVEAAGIETIALGTVFNVRLDDNAVVVLVTEGRVRVAPVGVPSDYTHPHPVAVVNAGERTQVLLDPGEPNVEAVVVPLSVDELRSALHWQNPHFSFEDTPLKVAVAEFNRVNTRRIVITDPKLRETRIGGAFRVDNVEGFIRSIELTLKVEAVSIGNNSTLLRLLQSDVH